jgi:hypothetical protein
VMVMWFGTVSMSIVIIEALRRATMS